MIGSLGSATDHTPTARTTARGKATTPSNASSCVENSTDATATSTNTCRRGDSGRTPDAEGGREVEGKYRQQSHPNDSGARWSRGHPPEQHRTPPPGHGPGPGGYTHRFPRGRGHENRRHPSGGCGRGHGEGFGQVTPPDFSSNSPPNVSPNLPPGQFPDAPRHAFAADYSHKNEYMGYSGWGAAAGH